MNRQQERSAETRQLILQAARELFARSGYQAAGVAEICRAAGVSKGAFYHHFASKQAVFLALLDQWLDGVEQALAALRLQQGSVPDGLLSMAGMMEEILRAGSAQLPIYLEFLAQAIRDPQVWTALIAPYQRYREYFAKMVRAGIQEGSLRAVDAHLAAQVLIALAVGILVQGLLDSQQEAWGRVATQGLLLFFEGIRKG